MIAIDSNVLIAAHRAEHVSHKISHRRLLDLAQGDEPWAIPVFCLGEFLRVVTHPRVFAPPSALEVACLFIDRLLGSPTARLLLPADQYWDTLQRLSLDAEAGGNLVFDAQIAAVCRDAGVRRLLTFDRDFARFLFLQPERP